ncbi:Gfo/Idh/MocA family oxidoreductase [Carnobacterium viridans]|uniref:Predicted dehydrogenase n=1 Tax=Carnobacterium viridans TaxID=174587 RepID=A0A1H1A8V8_9LACT|nr:Gfo/Idh/MocA family oxidoreductase [Carnobacterium viridans]UDE94250.1 Gfo/Idh/MocA family oxidoreductase [Carnobacterium viridans]SDQ36092.1 Predicted dehydrogenase [Carnobacterium viridans]
MLTMAYIGNGKSTNRYHLPFSQKAENIHVKTIYSWHENSSWDKVPGVYYTTNLEEIWNDPDIQLVVICLPSSLHFEFAKLALEKGKNVLVEKPFTETAKEAKELFELAKSKKLLVQCYQNRRYDSDFLTAQKVIESGIIGELLEVEMHYDYFRPEVPENAKEFSATSSYLYGHGCHTIDQVLSYFGEPDSIHYDVRQLLGPDRMNDYFDLDFYYSKIKVSVKSSYFRIKQRPSFVLYGKKGMFIKQEKDRQEEHLKLFYMPTNPDFGIDTPDHYGTVTYVDDDGLYHEEKVVSEIGDYSYVYKGLHESIINGKDKLVKDEETIRQLEILEEGIQKINY